MFCTITVALPVFSPVLRPAGGNHPKHGARQFSFGKTQHVVGGGGQIKN